MPSTTLKSKGSHSCQRLAVPMSERQQLALLMQMSSADQQGVDGGSVSPKSPSGLNPSPRSRNRNERGETPLHVAAIKGDQNQVRKLLMERGADPNATDFAGWTPLHEACNKGWYEVAKVLLEAGATVNACGYDDITPLHDAAVNGHAKLVRLLVSRGADVTQRNKWGKTPRDDAAPGLDTQLFQDLGRDKLVSQVCWSRDEKRRSVVTCLTDTMDAKGVTEEVKEEPLQASTDADKPCEKAAEERKTPIEFDDGSSTAVETGVKRSLLDVGDAMEEGEEDAKKKKRRDSDATPGRQLASKNASAPDKSTKLTPLKAGTSGPTTKQTSNVTTTDRNSPVLAKAAETEDDNEEMPLAKCLSGINEGGPKVPPLKIVIPQQSTTLEQEQGARNGKNGKTHQALPYVVASSNSNDSVSDKEVSTNPSPTDCGGGAKGAEDKKEANLTAEERSHPRVLRSSHRSGGSSSSSSSGSQPATGTAMNTSGGNNSGSNASSPQPGSSNSVGDRNSNNSSPHQTNSQGQSPLPDVVPPIPADEVPVINVTKAPIVCASPPAVEVKSDPVDPPTHPLTLATTPSVELHPRKRKLKQSKEAMATPSTSVSEPPEVASVVPEVHPHDQPITNCYQLFLDIRKQIERRRKGLFPVQPKPPQGFKDYLMNRCTYVLAGNASSRLSIPNVTPPQSLQGSMKDLFTEQEKERYRLRMQHVIEKEKLVLSVEQEILRVHGRAARALANQTRPFSVCTILKDEEVYNVITPEQEEKDRNARSRYNGRLFLSWLQDVDDKWEKIKESMCLRHHNEAESLHAVQKMDWEWKMKELGICEFKAKPVIEDLHVPMVHVSDDFDLLPA